MTLAWIETFAIDLANMLVSILTIQSVLVA